MDKFLEVIGAAGYPTTTIGGVLLLFFYLRKAEAGMRTEINGSLARLQGEKAALQTEIDRLEEEADRMEDMFDQLRKDRRDAEDREIEQRRRAELAEAKLKELGL